MYTPKPINTTKVELSAELTALGEKLAEHVHDCWAETKIAQGKLDHPDLLPYGDLTEAVKDYDRCTATGTLKAILALGFQIVPPQTTVPIPTEIARDQADIKRLGAEGYEAKCAFSTQMNTYVVMQKNGRGK